MTTWCVGAREGKTGQHLLQLKCCAPNCRVSDLAELAAGDVGGGCVHHSQDNGCRPTSARPLQLCSAWHWRTVLFLTP